MEARQILPQFDVSEAMYRKIRCPVLIIHGDNDQIQPYERAKLVAELTGAEFITIAGGGHNPLGRFPAKCNALIVRFSDRGWLKLATSSAVAAGKANEHSISRRPSGSGMRDAILPSRANCDICTRNCKLTGLPRIR